MIDATHLKAHRTAASLLKKGLYPNYRPHQRRAKLQASGRLRRQVPPFDHALSEGQLGDYKGAALMIDALPRAKALLADQGYNADWFRAALEQRGIIPSIHQRRTVRCSSRTTPASTASAIGSRTCSAISRTGGASTFDTTDALTRSCPPSALRQPSSSGWLNES